MIEAEDTDPERSASRGAHARVHRIFDGAMARIGQVWALSILCFFVGTAPAADAPTRPTEPKTNWFDDPFFQISQGLPGCPVPEGPLYTEAERRTQIHSRLERGTSCWLAGQCADSNAYRYDQPLARQVRAALAAVPGVRRSSVWVIVQRRWVYLQGCTPTRDLGARLERAAHAVPDVEAVVPDLMTGTRGKPAYPVLRDSTR